MASRRKQPVPPQPEAAPEAPSWLTPALANARRLTQTLDRTQRLGSQCASLMLQSIDQAFDLAAQARSPSDWASLPMRLMQQQLQRGLQPWTEAFTQWQDAEAQWVDEAQQYSLAASLEIAKPWDRGETTAETPAWPAMPKEWMEMGRRWLETVQVQQPTPH